MTLRGTKHTAETRQKMSDIARAKAKARKRKLGLEFLRETAPPGTCVCCGDPALELSTNPDAARKRAKGSGRTHQDTCGAPECLSARFRYWARDRRWAATGGGGE